MNFFRVLFFFYNGTVHFRRLLLHYFRTNGRKERPTFFTVLPESFTVRYCVSIFVGSGCYIV